MQIIEQIRYLIATGTLKANDRMPSVIALAREHVINPNTVVRAYLQLEYEGLVYKKRGMGTYVAETDVKMSQQEKDEIVRELLKKALVQGVQLGMKAAQLRQLFEESLYRFQPNKSEKVKK